MIKSQTPPMGPHKCEFCNFLPLKRNSLALNNPLNKYDFNRAFHIFRFKKYIICLKIMVGWMFRGRGFRARCFYVLVILGIVGLTFGHWDSITNFNFGSKSSTSEIKHLDHLEDELKYLINLVII